MKICLIGPAPPFRGGIANYNTQLALELLHHHEVSLISFSRQYPALLFPGRTQLDPRSPSLTLGAEPLLDSIDPRTWVRTARRIADLSPDLVVIHWWHPFFGPAVGALARLAKRHRHITCAFICHNVVPHEPFPAMRPITRFALCRGDAWLVHSTADRRELESLRIHGRIVVTPPPPARGFGAPIDKADAKSRLGLSGNVLLFFGLIRRYKGLPLLIEALSRVLQTIDCTLLVVGEFYQDKSKCLKLSRSLGLASKVRIVDRFIPNEEVSLYFCAADLVVLPYESATQSGIVPIAYAFERPVVATRVGGLPEAVRDGETGLLVEPGNAAALAEAIVRFYRDRLEEPFSRQIARRRADFCWRDMARAVESLRAAP